MHIIKRIPRNSSTSSEKYFQGNVGSNFFLSRSAHQILPF